MSRKVANILYGLSSLATAPMTPRLRLKTKAGLVAKMQRDLTDRVETPQGTLSLFTSRSSNIAAAVSG